MDTLDEMMNFFDGMNAGAKTLEDEETLWLEVWCEKFLADVYNQIVIRDVIDTGDLLKSFQRGEKDNVWIEKDGGLSIEVGSENPYAAAVNNGHKTCPPGVAERWVPGYWSNGRFIYDKSAKTGMLLRQQWIDAQPFFSAVERHASEGFQKMLALKLDEFLEHIWR